MQTRAEHLLADAGGVGHHALVLHRVDGRHRGRTGQRVTRVGEPAGIGAVGEGVVDGVVDGDATQWHVAGGDALGEGDQVGDDVEVLDREPLSGPAEAGHHLVGDHHDAVPVADLPHAGHVAGRRNHDSGGAGDRLQDDRGDRRRPLVGDQALEVIQGPLAFLLLVLGVERRAVQERSVEVHHTSAGVVAGNAAGVAGQVDRGLGAAVVRAVPGEHLAAAGVQTGHPDRMLDGVGAGVGEEHMVQIARGALGDQPGGLGPRVVDELRGDGAQLGRLLGDRGDHLGVLMADVGEDQLPGVVEQPVAVAVPHVGALGRQHGHRLDLRLGRPGVEDVLAVELVGAFAVGDRGVDVLTAGQGGVSRGHQSCLLCRKPDRAAPCYPDFAIRRSVHNGSAKKRVRSGHRCVTVGQKDQFSP